MLLGGGGMEVGEEVWYDVFLVLINNWIFYGVWRNGGRLL
jgi:hypothetical protein